MATVHLLCGKVGSGKTTFAKRLEQNGAVRFSTDEWMLRLYGPRMPRKEFDARYSLCVDLILDLSERLALLRLPVVVDAGFWWRAERDDVRQRLTKKGVPWCFHFFDVPEPELWRRIEQRNKEGLRGTFEITREMFLLFADWFEAPGPDEDFHVVDLVGRPAEPPTTRRG